MIEGNKKAVWPLVVFLCGHKGYLKGQEFGSIFVCLVCSFFLGLGLILICQCVETFGSKVIYIFRVWIMYIGEKFKYSLKFVSQIVSVAFVSLI